MSPSANRSSPPSGAPTLQPMPWHADAEASLAVNRLLWLLGPPSAGKTFWAADYALRTTGQPPFEVQASPELNETALWGKYLIEDGQSAPRDAGLAAAIRAGGIFVLNDVHVLPNQTLSTLLGVGEAKSIVNKNTFEVLTIPKRFRLVLTGNLENRQCRPGEETLHGLISRSLPVCPEHPDRATLQRILQADFPDMPSEEIDQALAHRERFQPARDGDAKDRVVFRPGIREARQYLLLRQHGTQAGTAVRLAFVNKFAHDRELYEAMKLKLSLLGGG